jgi:hypothetical protein
MRTTTLALALALLAGTAGRAAAEEKTLSASCDQQTKKGRVCTDVTWNTPEHTEASARQGCTEKGGTVVPSCSHKGAVGGCRVGMSDGSKSFSTTAWQYAGDAKELAASCAAMGGTLVKP